MKRMIQKTWMACIALMCVCFASCNDDAIVEASQPNETGQPFRLTATQGTPSRLALGEDGLTVMWEPGDKLYLVKKDRSIAPIELIADIEEAATEATFISQSGVPAGEYHVVYNYNDDMVYEHVQFMSLADINDQDKLALWGELTISEGDTSAEITLQHIYAKIRVELKNAPESGCFQIGMYTSGQTGFPIYRMLTNKGLVNTNEKFHNFYQTENEKFHHLQLGSFMYNYNEGESEYNTSSIEEVEQNSALILPEDVSDGILFFYILKDNKCYEIAKSDVKFEAGKSYKVKLDMAGNDVVITTLSKQRATLPNSDRESSFYALSTVEECRHAAYRNAYADGQYIITENIDFANDVFLPFSAECILGNGKIISNISLDWQNDDNVGLVRLENYPSSWSTNIYNLTLENVSFKGNNNIGAFGGYNISANNCKLIGESTIEGIGNYVGGIVGENILRRDDVICIETMHSIEVEETCIIKGNEFVGGIVGAYNQNSGFYLDSSIKLLDLCTSSASVTAIGNYAGGIVGKINIAPTFDNEDAIFSLNKCINKGIVIGNNYVGGIVGNFNTNISSSGIVDKVVIKTSINEGRISGSNYVGGIAGSTGVSINTCYSINDISATNNYSGGIAGEIYLGYITPRIANCYSLANISVGQNGYAGGIVGRSVSSFEAISIVNSYFAGTNSSGYGIVGYSDKSCYIGNCLTTLSLVGSLNNDPNAGIPDKVINTLTNVTSIKENKAVINGDSAYSDEIWSFEDYPAYCLKFSTGFSGGIIVPGFGCSEIEI